MRVRVSLVALVALCLCAAVRQAVAQISYVDQCSAASTACTTPTHQVGDLIIVIAGRTGSSGSTAPALGTGMTAVTTTSINGTSSNDSSTRIACRVATGTNSTSDPVTGFTNASSIVAMVFRGTRPLGSGTCATDILGTPSNYCSPSGTCGTDGTGVTTATFKAITNGNNRSWVAGLIYAPAATGHVADNITGMTNRSSQGTIMAGKSSTAGVASFAQYDLTITTASRVHVTTVEIMQGIDNTQNPSTESVSAITDTGADNPLVEKTVPQVDYNADPQPSETLSTITGITSPDAVKAHAYTPDTQPSQLIQFGGGVSDSVVAEKGTGPAHTDYNADPQPSETLSTITGITSPAAVQAAGRAPSTETLSAITSNSPSAIAAHTRNPSTETLSTQSDSIAVSKGQPRATTETLSTITGITSPSAIAESTRNPSTETLSTQDDSFTKLKDQPRTQTETLTVQSETVDCDKNSTGTCGVRNLTRNPSNEVLSAITGIDAPNADKQIASTNYNADPQPGEILTAITASSLTAVAVKGRTPSTESLSTITGITAPASIKAAPRSPSDTLPAGSQSAAKQYATALTETLSTQSDSPPQADKQAAGAQDYPRNPSDTVYFGQVRDSVEYTLGHSEPNARSTTEYLSAISGSVQAMKTAYSASAIGFLTSATGADNTTNAASLPITLSIAAGDVIVVAVNRGANYGVTGVTDNGGNTYTPYQQLAANAPRTALFATLATSPATTITVSFPAATKTSAVAAKYSNVSGFGSNTNQTRGTGTSASITGALAQTSNWMVCGLGHLGTTAPTATSGTLRTDRSNNSNGANSSILDITNSLMPTCTATYGASSTNWGATYLELVAAQAAQYAHDLNPVQQDRVTDSVQVLKGKLISISESLPTGSQDVEPIKVSGGASIERSPSQLVVFNGVTDSVTAVKNSVTNKSASWTETLSSISDSQQRLRRAQAALSETQSTTQQVDSASLGKRDATENFALVDSVGVTEDVLRSASDILPTPQTETSGSPSIPRDVNESLSAILDNALACWTLSGSGPGERLTQHDDAQATKTSARAWSFPQTDSIPQTDATSKMVAKQTGESQTLSADAQKGAGKPTTESVPAISESRLDDSVKGPTQLLSQSDGATAQKNAGAVDNTANTTDALTASDSVRGDSSKPLTETLMQSDSIEVSQAQSKSAEASETLTQSDSVNSDHDKQLAEVLPMQHDAAGTNQALGQTADVAEIIADLSFSVTLDHGRELPEVLSDLVDVVAVDSGKGMNELLAQSDFVSIRVKHANGHKKRFMVVM